MQHPDKIAGPVLAVRCSLSIPSQAVRQAPVEPGMQNMTVLLAKPPKARDWTVDVPISV